MTSYPPPECTQCVHYRTNGPLTCAAFPAGIPDPIIFSEVLHRNPYPGDNGIVFSPVDDYEEDVLVTSDIANRAQTPT